MAFSDLDHFKSRWLGSSFWMARLERLVMFRSSVAAFYALPRRHFYGCGYVLRGRFRSYCRRLQIPSEIKKIVHRMSQILFAAEIAFRRLHRRMPQQELNLLQLATAGVQRRTFPAKRSLSGSTTQCAKCSACRRKQCLSRKRGRKKRENGGGSARIAEPITYDMGFINNDTTAGDNKASSLYTFGNGAALHAYGRGCSRSLSD